MRAPRTSVLSDKTKLRWRFTLRRHWSSGSNQVQSVGDPRHRHDRGRPAILPAAPARFFSLLSPAFRVIRGFWRRDRGITAGRKAGSLRQARKRLEKRLPILSLAREVVD